MKIFKKFKFKSMGRFFLTFASMLMVYATVSLVIQYGEYNKRQTELAELEQQKQELILQKEELQHQLEYTKTDEYIEQTMREKLNWAKPGERRYVEK